MDEIEVVVKIPEDMYKYAKKYNGSSMLTLRDKEMGMCMGASANGTPLPKGHGKIGDLDKLIRTMKERNDDNGGEPLNAVDRGYDLAFQHMIEESKECVIIEADKEDNE